MLIRFAFNSIGGLYMFKRLSVATILAASAFNESHSGNEKLFLIPLVCLEIIFGMLRFIL